MDEINAKTSLLNLGPTCSKWHQDYDRTDKMEIETKQTALLSIPQNSITKMDDYAVEVFDSMTKEKCLDEAVHLMRMLPLHLPPVEVFQELLYDIFLTSEDDEIVQNISLYIMQLLSEYPPVDSERREYYMQVLFGNNYYRERTPMWKTLSCIIRGCFRKCGIAADFVGKKRTFKRNCLEMLEIFVAIILKDHQEAISSRSASSSELVDTMISNVFWRSGQINNCSSEFRTFISYINAVFATEISGETLKLFEYMMKLLNAIVRHSFVYANYNEVEALDGICCKPIDDLKKELCFCLHIRTCVKNMEWFLGFVDMQFLRIIICQSVLNQMLYNNWHQIGDPLTLNKIVERFMFPVGNPFEETQEEIVFSDGEKEVVGPRTCVLHKACLTNSPGTLQELLMSSSTLFNVLNARMQTPLHVACSARSFLCVILLLRTHRNQVGNVFARDLKGNTALHIASKTDQLSIAVVLLKIGGRKLAKMKNYKGLTALDVSKSVEMKLILKQSRRMANLAKGESSVASELGKMPLGDIPALCQSSDCEVYLFCIYTILSEYISFFKLQDLLVDSHCGESVAIEAHLQKHFKCSAKPSLVTHLAEDLEILKNLPSCVDHFGQRLKEVACSLDFDLEEGLACLNFITALL